MNFGVILHILAGLVALVAGYTALFAPKGRALHRGAGMVFVLTMLGMAGSGGVLAAVLDFAPAVNVPAAILTIYLVVTAWTTVRPPARGAIVLSRIGLVVALGVGVVSLVFGVEAVAAGGVRKGIPAFPFFLFGVVGLLASGLDARMIRAGGIRGSARLARHLWRMCFALFIAALSFFLGQADNIPEAVRAPALLAAPILIVLVAMFYWLWRVRRKPPRSRVGVE